MGFTLLTYGILNNIGRNTAVHGLYSYRLQRNEYPLFTFVACCCDVQTLRKKRFHGFIIWYFNFLSSLIDNDDMDLLHKLMKDLII